MKPFLKPAALTALALLAGCLGTSEPRTQDSKGRAFASTSEAVDVFVKACVNSRARSSRIKSALRRAGNFTITPSIISESAFTAAHTIRSMDLISLDQSACSLSFDNDQSGREAGVAATLLLVASTDAQSVGEGLMQASVSLVTSQGKITIRNQEQGRLHGVALMFFPNR